MKKILSVITISCLLLVGCEKDDSKQPLCNSNTPGWGENLGKVSFVTEREWAITNANGDTTQIWSDAVQAEVCNLMTITIYDTIYDTIGGKINSRLVRPRDTIVPRTRFGTSGFNADCRANPNEKGNLFSWCAIYRFQNQLCPDDWRVPTQQDFIDLSTALGGTENSTMNTTLRNRYLYDWGGFYSGISNPGGLLEGQGIWGHYWTQSNDTDLRAFNLYFSTSGRVFPQDISFKSIGSTLRCVRNK